MKQAPALIGNEEFQFICALIAIAHNGMNLNLNRDHLVRRVTGIFGKPKTNSVPEDLVARIRDASPEVWLMGDFFFPYGIETMPERYMPYLDRVKSILKEAFY